MSEAIKKGFDHKKQFFILDRENGAPIAPDSLPLVESVYIGDQISTISQSATIESLLDDNGNEILGGYIATIPTSNIDSGSQVFVTVKSVTSGNENKATYSFLIDSDSDLSNVADVANQINSNTQPKTPGSGCGGGSCEDAKGWTGGFYNEPTGQVIFTSDDGLGFVTGDLRGQDGEGEESFEGGSAATKYLISQGIDAGSADTNTLPGQTIDAGGAE